MKFFTCLFFLTLCISFLNAQSLPIDFEGDVTTEDFINFDGGISTVIDNPQMDEENMSNSVCQIIRNGGATWAGSKIVLDANLDFSTSNVISMKVYTSAPVGTTVKLKLEGDGSIERDMPTSATSEWHTISWDFTGEPANFNEIVFMFDFGNIGDGSENSTFLFDDIQHIFGGSQIDLPVNFESSTVNYTLTPFEGNIAFLTTDPLNENNTVAQSMKSVDASPSAGTTIGTQSGFATDIPLTLSDSKMTVKVWTPSAGIPVRLKVEDSKDPTHTCETQTNTTKAAQWETLEFDFTNEAPGTELLSVGLDKGWTYNKASIFFNFGTDGASDNGTAYYFDDIMFGELVLSNKNLLNSTISVSPNPTYNNWTIESKSDLITKIELYSSHGQKIKAIYPSSFISTIDATELNAGLYFLTIYTTEGAKTERLIKK